MKSLVEERDKAKTLKLTKDMKNQLLWGLSFCISNPNSSAVSLLKFISMQDASCFQFVLGPKIYISETKSQDFVCQLLIGGPTLGLPRKLSPGLNQ